MSIFVFVGALKGFEREIILSSEQLKDIELYFNTEEEKIVQNKKKLDSIQKKTQTFFPTFTEDHPAYLGILTGLWTVTSLITLVSVGFCSFECTLEITPINIAPLAYIALNRSVNKSLKKKIIELNNADKQLKNYRHIFDSLKNRGKNIFIELPNNTLCLAIKEE